MKETKRMAFNFLRSYFDVVNQLKTDKDKLDFLLAVINKQFLNEDPDSLDFIPNLCYESQRHSIEKSVKGWIRANNGNPPCNPMSNPPSSVGSNPKEEEVEGEVEVKEKVQSVALIEDKHRDFSIKFYNQLKEKAVISKTVIVNKGQIDHIRKLEKVDKIDWSDITSGANYYFSNLDSDFMPEIQSTKAFRDKFDKLVAHKKRKQ